MKGLLIVCARLLKEFLSVKLLEVPIVMATWYLGIMGGLVLTLLVGFLAGKRGWYPGSFWKRWGAAFYCGAGIGGVLLLLGWRGHAVQWSLVILGTFLGIVLWGTGFGLAKRI